MPVSYTHLDVYKRQALPYESNPILMCVNKDLLDKEGIAVPKEGWTLEEFYTICKKLTKDTNGDGQLDQFGSTEYTWKEALAANGGHLFQGGMLKLTAPEVKESLTFLQKLEDLNKNYKVSSKDFDQGKVCLLYTSGSYPGRTRAAWKSSNILPPNSR